MRRAGVRVPNAAGGAVWITRPHPSGRTTAAVVERAGYRVLSLPVLEVVWLDRAPLPGGVPDWILFVSANAVQGLEEAIRTSPPIRFTRTKIKTAAVGGRTAAAARDAGWGVDLVAEPENAEGLMASLAGRSLWGTTCWIPGGNRAGSARDALPEFLTQAGSRAVVFPVYETRDRELPADELALLAAAVPGAIVVHSSSAAEALFRPQAPAPVRRWREASRWISIGPATTQCLGGLGADGVTECPDPSDAAVARALASVLVPDVGRKTS